MVTTAEPLISTGKAAEILGVSRVTLHQWIAQGRLRAFYLPTSYRQAGGKRYLPQREVEALARERAATGESETGSVPAAA